MRIAGCIVLLLLVSGIAAADPMALRSQIDEYAVEITFVDGLPLSGEQSRIAVTVMNPDTRTIPDEPALLYVTGGPRSFLLQLDRVPTTYVTLPILSAGDYDIRVQVPGLGATDALLLRVAEPPLFEADPLVGGLMVSLGTLFLVLILLSGRFDRKDR